MRDEYIRLVKEYIRLRPDYEHVLEELRENVKEVGATNEEFDEAIKQFTDKPRFSRSKNLILKYSDNTKNKTLAFLKITRSILSGRKKYIFTFSLSVFLLAIFLAPKLFEKNKIKVVNLSTQESVSEIQSLENKNIIPVVYANSNPYDPTQIFSADSSSVKLIVTGKPKKEVLGFFPSWMLSKQDKVNISMLTSISLFGLEVGGDGNIITGEADNRPNGWSMWKDPNLDDLIKRARSDDIKIYLTLKAFNSANIERLTQSDNAQKAFIANALYLINSKNLDGINIDFEYVGTPTDAAREGFTRLIANLNSEMKRQIPNAVLTIDTYLVSGADGEGLFNIPALSKNIEAFVIMGYDVHHPSGGAGPVSPMGGATNVIGYVQNYLEKVGPEKLILAFPYYGYDWPQNSIAESQGMARGVPYGIITQQSKNINISWNETSQTPYYAYKTDGGGERIVHFDNVRSLSIKYDFINKKGLRGVGIWALGYDGDTQDLQKLMIDKFIYQ